MITDYTGGTVTVTAPAAVVLTDLVIFGAAPGPTSQPITLPVRRHPHRR